MLNTFFDQISPSLKVEIQNFIYTKLIRDNVVIKKMVGLTKNKKSIKIQ